MRPDTVFFELGAGRPVAQSLYRTIHFLDQRRDTTNLGYIFSTLGTDRIILPRQSLSRQLQHLVDGMVDSLSGNGSLLFQLERLSVFDTRGTFSHICATLLRAHLYAVDASGYRVLGVLDTTIREPYGKWFDHSLQRRLFASIGGAITQFIAIHLTRQAGDAEAMSMAGVWNIETVTKLNLPLYARDSLTEGVYTSYGSLSRMEPAYTRFAPVIVGDELVVVQVIDSAGRHVNLELKQIYALVYHGQIIVVRGSASSNLVKKQGDFLYIDKMSVQGWNHINELSIAAWCAATALAGRVPFMFVWSNSVKKRVVFKLDCVNGAGIPLRLAARGEKL